MMGGIALDANPPGRDCASGYDSRALLIVVDPLAAAWARDGSYFSAVGLRAGLARGGRGVWVGGG